MGATKCKHCGDDMKSYEYGACVNYKGELYTGHYECVYEALDQDGLAASAMRAGALPVVQPGDIVDRKLKKHIAPKRPAKEWWADLVDRVEKRGE